MNSNENTDDRLLRRLLRAARPGGELPPGFVASVWRRIELSQTPVSGWATLLLRCAGFLLEPRRALAALVAVSLLGALTGLVQGWQRAREVARERYVTAVSPLNPWP